MSDYIKRSDIPYRDLAEGHNTDVKVLVAFASDIAEIPSADVVDKSLYDRAVSGEVELEKAESVSNSQNINHSALKEQIKKYLKRTNMCKEQVWKAKVEAKLPSLNEYINACRTNRYAGAEMKRQAQTEIGYFINRFPRFEKPVKIRFTWLEGNKRRDLDNVCFAKKFILDAMVECGKLQDDNRKNVTGFTDTFQYGDEWGVIIEVEEVEP